MQSSAIKFFGFWGAWYVWMRFAVGAVGGAVLKLPDMVNADWFERTMIVHNLSVNMFGFFAQKAFHFLGA